MLIAHLPAGYLLGSTLQKLSPRQYGKILAAAIIGSLAPDFDMIYFHLIDGRQTHHHEYFTHWPLFWLAVMIGLSALVLVTKPSRLPVVLAFSAGTLLHMVMDTIAAPVLWLMPFSSRSFEMVSVPATYQNWILSFIVHWTFLLEIMIWVASIAVFARRRGLAS